MTGTMASTSAHHGARRWTLVPLLLACFNLNQGVLAADGRAPRITEHPVSAAGQRQDPMTLRCQADGRPAPSVTWTKDGKPLELAGGFSHRVLLPGGNLFFLRLDPADAGAYRCVADNGVGEPAVSREATLEVAYLKHEFRAAPSSQMVTAGDAVVLQCGPPRGRPDPAVHWRKDGRRLDVDQQGLGERPGERQPRLRLVDGTNLAIRDARPGDSGRYQCVAQNVAGTRESLEATVQVAVPPHFVARPVDTTALLGSSAVLRCEVAGDPKPSVQWRRGGGQGHAGHPHANASTRVQVLADRALRIAAVRLADAGVYVCEADNGAGVVSASATLSVVSEPTLAPAPPRVLRLEPNSTATLSCAARGVPAPLVTWSVMGNRSALLPGQAVDRLAVSRDAASGAVVATLQQVTRADSGRVLVCAAVNAAGAAVSRTRLVVLPGEQWPPPVVVTGPGNVTLPLHSAVALPCRTATAARPRAATTVAWLKDGQPVRATSRVQQAGSGALQIQDLQAEDAGEYTCVASSRSGRYRWTGTLRVAAEGVAVQRGAEPAALPGAPGPVRVNGSDQGVVLSWQRNAKVGSSTLQGYVVEVLARPAEEGAAVADPPTWSTAARLPATTTTYSFAPPSDALAYMFLVRAVNGHGLSPASELVGPVARGADGRWTERGHGWLAGGRGRDDDGETDAEDEDMADVQDALDLAPVVRLTEVVVASATSVKALWDVLDPDQVEGLSIYWWAEAGGEANQTEAADTAVALQSLTVQTHPASSSPGAGLGLGFQVTGLRCYTVYHFFLVPFNQQGEGRPSNSARIRTLPGAPSAPPTRLEATLINGSTALVKWSPPPTHFQNGPLQSYQVVVQAGEPPELVSNVTLSTLSEDGALQLLLSNLSHHSAYSVSVAAATAAGLGPFSAPLTVRPTAPVGQHRRHDAEGGGGGGELLTETWFMALLGSMVAVMVLLFSAIIFLHRRQHRANKETFLGFYDCGPNGPVLTTPLTLKASEGMPHPLSAPLPPPLCLVPQDTYGAKYRGVSPGAHPPHGHGHGHGVEDLMLPEYAEANDAQYEGSLSQGSASSKSYYAEVRSPHMMSTFQSTSHPGAGGSQGGCGSQGSQRTGTGSSYGGAAPYATTTLVCSARTASTAPSTAACSSSSTSWSQDNERCYPDQDGRPALASPSATRCAGHYDNYTNYASHAGSQSPLEHRDAALSLQSRCASSNRGQGVPSGGGGTGTLGRENRRLKLLRRQHNRSAHAKGLPPSGPPSSQLQLLLRSSPSSSRSGSTQGGSPPDQDDVDASEVHRCLGSAAGPAVTPLRQDASDYHSSSSGSSGRRYGRGARPQARPVVAYSGLSRRGP